MQARRSKTFVEHHLAMLALAIGLLAVAVTLIIAGAISSDQGSNTVQVAQPATGKPAVSIPSGIGFDPGYVDVETQRMNWGLGVTLDAGNVSASTVRQEWGLGVGFDAGHVAATTSGLNTVRQLPGLGIGFDPGFVSRQPAPQAPVLGTGPTDY